MGTGEKPVTKKNVEHLFNKTKKFKTENIYSMTWPLINL